LSGCPEHLKNLCSTLRIFEVQKILILSDEDYTQEEPSYEALREMYGADVVVYNGTKRAFKVLKSRCGRTDHPSLVSLIESEEQRVLRSALRRHLGFETTTEEIGKTWEDLRQRVSTFVLR
jgi:hypothetical protein